MAQDAWDMPEAATTEEVILSKHDTAAGYCVSVRLITYPDGTQDLFRQAGSEFNQHIAEAKVALEARGLVVGDVEVTFRTGAYLPVRQKLEALPDALSPVRENPLTLAMTPFEGHAAMVQFVYSDQIGTTRRKSRQIEQHR